MHDVDIIRKQDAENISADESYKKFELFRSSNVLTKHNFPETGSASLFNAPKLVDT
jgi:hypothetical protein